MSLKEQLTAGAIKSSDSIKEASVPEQIDASAVNEKDDRGKTALHVALDRGGNQLLTSLLSKSDIDVNTKDGNGSTALHSALWRNNLHAVTKLLAAPGIDVNLKDGYGDTPLQVALELANLQDNAPCITQLLATTGIDVNAKSGVGLTPLHTACRENVHVGPILACTGLNVNVKADFGMTSGVTPVMVAARFCGQRMLKRMLDDGRVDLEVRDDEGCGVEEWCGVGKEKCLKMIRKERLRRWKKNGKNFDLKRKELDERQKVEMDRLVKRHKEERKKMEEIFNKASRSKGSVLKEKCEADISNTSTESMK